MRSNTCYVVLRMSNAYHVSKECIRSSQNSIWAGKRVGCLPQQGTPATLCYFDGTELLGGFLFWLHRDAACVRTKPLMDRKPSMGWGCFEVPQRSQHDLDCLKNLQGIWKAAVASCIAFFLKGGWLLQWSKGHNLWSLHSCWWHQ